MPQFLLLFYNLKKEFIVDLRLIVSTEINIISLSCLIEFEKMLLDLIDSALDSFDVTIFRCHSGIIGMYEN